uniref:Peptidase M16 N-terminal domain-containing protein n=1 Tax=Tetradesmus obliquus TaxID=3088 RepID=A0A383WE33_TETOB
MWFDVVNSAAGARLTFTSGAARPRVSSSSSSRSYAQQHAWSPYRQGPKPAGPHIAASVHVRGRRVIICASLAGVADSPTGTDSGSSSSSGSGSSSELLSQRVKGNQQLVTGQLSNGLRYVLLPNRTPPQRFEAHLEVHAGSVDEREHEQGVAHLVEHVTFLGSKRRESLLGTGARANAYTDFHHTVFHVHAPLTNCITGTPMLPQVLEALAEIAFVPQFLPMRLEKERKAVLAEAQMMNTIEYRIDCQLLTHLHAENNLGCRFPIGKTEQVKAWEHAIVQHFWAKWYFPGNVTLYIVGDLDRPNEEVIGLIEASFGRFPAGNLADHGADVATAVLERLTANGSSSSSNGAASNGSSSNGNGTAALAAAVDSLPAQLVPAAAAAAAAGAAEPGAYVASADGSWARNIIINGDDATVLGPGVMAVTPDGRKLRHPVRPPVVHRHGCGPLMPSEPPAPPVSIFRHPLLQHFMLTVFCKLPVVTLSSMGDLKYSFMVRLLLSAFQFRINQRYVRADPPFIGIELDISDSGREGCSVSMLTITAQPVHWQETVQAAVEEMRRLQRFGLTPSELERYILAIMRDSAQLSEQANSIPSINSLDFVMESLALGHTVMSHGEAHEAMMAVAADIKLEEVNAVAASLLTFASDVGREADMLAEAAQPGQEGKWARPGPTRATSVVACIPAYVSAAGDVVSVGGGMGHGRGGMGASGHLDADAINLEELESQGRQLDALQDMEAPEGAYRFDLSPEQILSALASPDLVIEPAPDVELPQHLVDPQEIEATMQELQPRFIPLQGELEQLLATPPEALEPALCCPPTDEDTGITQRRLSNGIRINYRHTDNEPKAGLLRIVAAGGRASEPREPGPGGVGAVAVGTRTLSEGGAVGGWSREQVEAFCIANLIQSVMDSNDEFLVLDVHFAATNGGLACAFELLHQVLQCPRWEPAAFERSKLAFIATGQSVGKSLERASSSKIMEAMLGPDMRFRDPPPEMLEQLTLEGVRDVLAAQLHPSNLELNVAGDFEPEELEALVLRYLGPADFEPEELEALVLRYLGTISSPLPPPSRASLMGPPISFQDPPLQQRAITWHLKDSDERAAAYIAGPAPCRWGPFGSRAPLAPLHKGISPPPPPATNPAAAAAATAARRAHPLYATVSLQLLAEVINSRLFTTVRDSLGLTYDVSFEVTTYDRLRTGWFSVLVTSYPDRIHEALAASLAVLRELALSPVTPRELMRAKRTLMTRHESELKDNNYWLGLLTHLQSPDVPYKRVECLRDLRCMYESATIDDLYDAYTRFDFSDEAVFTCVGTSGKAPPPPPDRARLDALVSQLDGSARGSSVQSAGWGNGASSSSSSSSSTGPNGAALPVDWAAAFSKAFGAAMQQQGGAPQAQVQQQQPQQPGQQQQDEQQQGKPDPMAMFTAMLAAAQGAKLAQALGKEKQQQEQQNGDGSSS